MALSDVLKIANNKLQEIFDPETGEYILSKKELRHLVIIEVLISFFEDSENSRIVLEQMKTRLEMK